MTELIEILKKTADRIPSMGGREMGPEYNAAISVMDNGLTVVEVGSWLGAGTAQLALAMFEHGKDKSVLHVYDRWKANGSEVKKAKRQGIKIKNGEDTLPIVRKLLVKFIKRVKIGFHRCNIKDIKYSGGDIGVFVIDAGKREGAFDTVIEKFEPYFVPGKTICFFMDYYYYLHKEMPGLEFQQEYIEGSGKYKEIGKKEELSCSVQIYTGGEDGTEETEEA